MVTVTYVSLFYFNLVICQRCSILANDVISKRYDSASRGYVVSNPKVRIFSFSDLLPD